MKSYPITVDGETFSFRSDGDPETVVRLIGELEASFEEMKRVSRTPRGGGGFRVMTMVAMVLLSELETLRVRHRQLGSHSLSFARDLSARIDELLLNGPS